MERTSTKHGRLTDEAMARETESLTRGAPVESRIEEFRMAEPAGEDDPEPTAVLHTLGEPVMGMPADEVAARSEFATSMRPRAFPADAPSLLRVALEEQAPEWVCEILRRVDQMTLFENVQMVWEAAGGHHELRTRPQAPQPPKRPAAKARRATPPVGTTIAVEPPTIESEREPDADRSYLGTVFDFWRAGWNLASRTTSLATAPVRRLSRLVHRGASA